MTNDGDHRQPENPARAYLSRRGIDVERLPPPARCLIGVPAELAPRCFPRDRYRGDGGDRAQQVGGYDRSRLAGLVQSIWHSIDGEPVAWELEGVDGDGYHVPYVDAEGETVKRLASSGAGIGSAAFVVRPLRPGGRRWHVCEGAMDALSVDPLGLAGPRDGIIAAHGHAGLPKLAPWLTVGEVLIYPHHLDHADVGEESARKLEALLGGRATVVYSDHSERHDLNDELRGKAPRRQESAGESSQPLMVRATDVDMSAPPVEWLWPNRIVKGKMCLLSGAGEAGKGLLGSAICAAVTTGTPLPGGDATEPGNVGWIGTMDEDGHRVALGRLLAASADRERVFMHPCDDIETEAALSAIVAECVTLSLKVAVIDSHAAWFVETVNGPKVRNEIRRAFLPLIRSGCTPLLIAHWRKASVEDGDPQHGRVAGNASGLVGAARCVLEVVKLDEGDHVVKVTKSNNAGRPDDLHFEVRTAAPPGLAPMPALFWTGATPPAPTSGGGPGGSIPSDDKIMEAVEDADPPLPTCSRVCKLLFGVSESGKARSSKEQRKGIKNALDRLVRSGRLTTAPTTVANVKREGYEVVEASGGGVEADSASTGTDSVEAGGGPVRGGPPPPTESADPPTPVEQHAPPLIASTESPAPSGSCRPANTDPIPQATAPAEPRRGVVACDNQQKETSMPDDTDTIPTRTTCFVCDGETDFPALHPIPHREGHRGGPLSVPVCPECSLRVVGHGLAALRKGGQPVMVGWPDDVRFEPAPPMTEQGITANRQAIVWGLLVDARAVRDEAAA